MNTKTNKLIFVTREKQTFNQKPILYISSYPGTLLYIKELCKDTLKLVDVIVCYKENLSQEINPNDLMNINIFILPVSSELFNKNGNIIDKEIEYAKKNLIPIIPILYDEGLEDSLFEKIGSYQLLYKHRINEHLNSFEYNYQMYLNHLMLNEQEKSLFTKVSLIRSYITYSNNDNNFNNQFRSFLAGEDNRFILGATYEKVIIPGSGFEDERKERIDDSKLVFILCTNNALNSDNVKKDYEYALAQKKNIILIIDDNVDKKDVKKEFKKTPAIYQLNKKLSKRLTKELKKNNVKKPLESLNSEYAFFLAELYDYGLRKDTNKALARLEKLEKVKYISALKKKKEMVLYGLGITPDKNLLKQIEQELIKACEDKYELIQDVNNGLAYLQELYDYGRFDVIDEDERELIFTKLMYTSESLWKQTKNIEVKKMLANSYKYLGIKYMNENDYESSNAFLTNYVVIYKEFDEQTNTIQSGKELVESYLVLAKMYNQFAEVKKAQEIYSLSIAKFELLLRTYKERIILKKEFAYLLKKYAAFLKEHYKFEEEIQCLERNCFIYEDVANREKTLENKNRLILSYDDLSQAYETNERYGLALEYSEKAQNIRSDIASDIRTIDSIRDYARGFEILGRISSYKDDKEKVNYYFGRAIKLREMIVSKVSTIRFKKELAKLLYNVGNIYRKYDDFDKAKEVFDKSKDIWNDLFTKQESLTSKSVCEIKYYLGLSVLSTSTSDDKDNLYKAMRLFEELLNKEEYKDYIVYEKQNIIENLRKVYDLLLEIYKDDKNRYKEIKMRKEVMLNK